MAHPPDSLHPALAQLLAGLRRRIRAYVWLEGIATALAVAGLAFWVSLIIDYLQEPPAAFRIGVLVVTGVALVVVLVRLIFRRAFVRLSDRSMAILLERRYGEFHDSLLTSVELGDKPHDDLEREMLVSARADALQQAGGIDVKKVFNPRPLARAATAASFLLLSILGFVLGSPDAAAVWSRRTFLLSNELWPRQTRLEIEGFADGRVKVARGADLELIVKADTAKRVPEVVEVRFRTDQGARGRENMVREGVADPAHDPFQNFSHKFQGLLTPLDFDVVGGDDRLRNLRIDVVDSPTITGMSLWCQYPQYMVREDVGLYTPRELPVAEFVQLPIGTNIAVRAKTNKTLTRVQIDRPQEDGSVKTESLDLAAKAERNFEYVIPSLEGDTTLLFTLSDTDGIKNREPIRLTLGAKPDEPPRVAVRLRGIGTAITAAARLPIIGEISDDYGLSKLWFEYAVDNNEEARRPLTKLPRGAAEAKFAAEDEEAFDVRDELMLQPKQKLLISVKAYDTYALEDEPQMGSSQQFVLDVVTPQQLRIILDGRELNLRRRFEQIIEEVTQTRESLNMVAIEPEKPRSETAPATDLDDGPASLASLYVQRGIQNSRKNAQETQGVAEGFDDIREELINNRLDTTELRARLKDRIADPLKQIVEQRFPALEQRLETLLTQLGNAEKGPQSILLAQQQADQILVEMNQVLSQMLELETFNEAIALLRSIMEAQEQMTDKTKKQRRSLLED